MTRVIVLGSRTACDDDAALEAVESMSLDAEVVMAGRPGPGLVDLLDPDVPTVLVDAVVVPLEPGALIELPLADLVRRVEAGAPISSHGLGGGQALRLAQALGRRLPTGTFVGIVAGNSKPGQGRSSAVSKAVPSFRKTIAAAVGRLA